MTIRQAMPAIYQYHPFVNAGGLVSYGPSQTDNYRQVGNYVGRILKGEKPPDLPVIQSSKVELIINLKTAKTARYNRPIAAACRADEVMTAVRSKNGSKVHCDCLIAAGTFKWYHAHCRPMNLSRIFVGLRERSAPLFGRHPSSTEAPVAQLDRAPDFESGGRGFESLRARQQNWGS